MNAGTGRPRFVEAHGGRSVAMRAESRVYGMLGGYAPRIREGVSSRENGMAGWDKESVESTVRDREWYESEREIQHGHQFVLVDETKINWFHTGRVTVQGKDTDIEREAEEIFVEQPPSSGGRSRSKSDSEYVVRAMNAGWPYAWKKQGWRRRGSKMATNRDLWAKLLDLCDKYDVRFEWVKGHAGHPENERCDQLSLAAARLPELSVDVEYGRERSRL